MSKTQVVVEYEGGIRGLHLAVEELRDAGLTVDYEPPMEQRSGETQAAIAVALGITSNLATDALKATVRRVVQKLAEHDPPVVIRLDDQDSWGSE